MKKAAFRPPLQLIVGRRSRAHTQCQVIQDDDPDTQHVRREVQNVQSARIAMSHGCLPKEDHLCKLKHYPDSRHHSATPRKRPGKPCEHGLRTLIRLSEARAKCGIDECHGNAERHRQSHISQMTPGPGRADMALSHSNVLHPSKDERHKDVPPKSPWGYIAGCKPTKRTDQ